MLKIVVGRAGSGKSNMVLGEIRRLGDESRQILIVPEHASHQAERDLCAVCGDTASRHARVMSFRYMAGEILSETGGAADTALDGGGKILTMYRAMHDNAGVLRVYRRPSQKAAFLEGFVAAAEELQSFDVSPESLLDISAELGAPLRDKLHDIVLVCAAYEAHLRDSGMDRRDRMTRLCEKLADSSLFDGADIFVDGFTYFTAQEERALALLLVKASSLTVTLLGDRADCDGVFDTTLRVTERLKRMAEKEGQDCETVWLNTENKTMTAPIRHIERHFFGTAEEYPEDTDAVRLMCAADEYAETEHAASEIRRLVASGKYRYRDIAVAARNIGDYEAAIENVFERYDIPVFLNRKRDILDKPVLTLLVAALEAIDGGFEYEYMFRYLKTGLAGLTADECDELENYVIIWDVRGGVWLRDEPWTANPRGYDAPFGDEEKAALRRINASRDKVRIPLSALSEGLKAGKTAREKTKAVYDFLTEIRLPELLDEKTQMFLRHGDSQLAEEYAQLWEILCAVMDQFVAMLADTEMDTDEFTRLMKLTLTQYDVGTIPVSLDQIAVSSLTRNDRHAVKCMFLLGATDSALPSVGDERGLLSESDRKELGQTGIRLAPCGMEKISIELQNIYAGLVQATERLCVSWPESDASGAELRASFVAERLKRLFPNIRTLTDADFRVNAAVPALERAGEAVGGELWKYFDELGGFSSELAAMEQAKNYRRGELSQDAVRTLYGEKLRMSASRIDVIHSCHYKYFMEYGLRAKERVPAGFDAPEQGTFVHYLLEHTAAEAKRLGGFAKLTDEDRARITDEYIAKFEEENLSDLNEKSARFRYLFGRLKKTARSIVDDVARELAESDFVPCAFELEFGGKGKIPAISIHAPEELTVVGKVDRVDGWIRNGKLYLRIIDYKTGKKKFDLAELMKGIGAQMLIYLFELQKNGRAAFEGEAEFEDIVPAGVLYVPARDPILSVPRGASDEDIREKTEKELRRSGLVLNDPQVLEAMEHGCTERPHYLPLRINREGRILDGAADAEQLGHLSVYVEKLLRGVAQEVAIITADPVYHSEQKNACTYCPFAPACNFENRRAGEKWNYVTPVTHEEFWERIGAKEGGDGNV
ncbi:MAG: PD-(D/E)XK nuclease family protein [Oscillospiraceae bacterium]|nr:PD-(D/E)XK nuclease family protein [Oscillospiraceae bacterium]